MESVDTNLEARPVETKQSVASKKRLILTAIKCVVSGSLIYWIVRGSNLGEIFMAVRSANTPLLLLGFSLNFVGIYVSAHRWRVLLKAQGVNVSFPFLLKSYLVGIFFNNFLPSTIGGDAVRAYDSWRVGKSKAGAVTVVFCGSVFRHIDVDAVCPWRVAGFEAADREPPLPLSMDTAGHRWDAPVRLDHLHAPPSDMRAYPQNQVAPFAKVAKHPGYDHQCLSGLPGPKRCAGQGAGVVADFASQCGHALLPVRQSAGFCGSSLSFFSDHSPSYFYHDDPGVHQCDRDPGKCLCVLFCDLRRFEVRSHCPRLAGLRRGDFSGVAGRDRIRASEVGSLFVERR